MFDEKITSFEEYLEEGWFERKWRNYKDGKDARIIKKLGKLHSKLLKQEKRANANKYRYDVVRLDYERMKSTINEAQQISQKLKTSKGTSRAVLDAVRQLDEEISRINSFVMDGINDLMINHRI